MFAFHCSSPDYPVTSPRRRAFGCVLMVCLLLAGCDSSGPSMGRVSGRVTYKNQPVANATVTFVPDQTGGRAATGITDAQGYYRLGTFDKADGALVGKHRVSVVARAPYEGKSPAGKGEAYLEELEMQGKPLIPERYFVAQTSPLTAEVKTGSNTHDLNLPE